MENNDDWVRGPNENILALNHDPFIPAGVIKKRPLPRRVLTRAGERRQTEIEELLQKNKCSQKLMTPARRLCPREWTGTKTGKNVQTKKKQRQQSPPRSHHLNQDSNPAEVTDSGLSHLSPTADPSSRSIGKRDFKKRETIIIDLEDESEIGYGSVSVINLDNRSNRSNGSEGAKKRGLLHLAGQETSARPDRRKRRKIIESDNESDGSERDDPLFLSQSMGQEASTPPQRRKRRKLTGNTFTPNGDAGSTADTVISDTIVSAVTPTVYGVPSPEPTSARTGINSTRNAPQTLFTVYGVPSPEATSARTGINSTRNAPQRLFTVYAVPSPEPTSTITGINSTRIAPRRRSKAFLALQQAIIPGDPDASLCNALRLAFHPDGFPTHAVYPAILNTPNASEP